MGLGNPGLISTTENRVDWQLTDPKGTRYDKVNASKIDAFMPEPDLVPLWFKCEGHTVQFRGTVSSIVETFSPSWEAVKYNGRADSGWKYSSFGRTLSFNFQVKFLQ